jgi:single-stranded DNA-binding protein
MFLVTKDGKAFGSGFVPRDAESFIVGEKGSLLVKFSIKVGETGTGDDKVAVWKNCIAWRQYAEIAKEIVKGDTVFVTGVEKTSTYTSRDGEEKTKTEVEIDFIQIQKRSSESKDSVKTTKTTNPTENEVPAPVDDSDDLPF